MQGLSIIALVAGVALWMPSTASANLLQNGDFSSGPQIGQSGFATVRKGQKSLAPWQVAKNSVDYIPAAFWQAPPNAIASIDLNGSNKPKSNKINQPGILEQQFATTPGDEYQVSFYRSGNPSNGCGSDNKVMVVEVGSVKKKYSWNITEKGNTLTNMEWTLQQFSFTATDSATTLAFISKTKGSCGPALGQVSVDAGS